MGASRNQLGAPGSPEYEANSRFRGFLQGAGNKSVEAPKQYITHGASGAVEFGSNVSNAYLQIEDITGEKRIVQAVEDGTTATVVYGQVYKKVNKILEDLSLPGMVNHLISDSVASHFRDRVIEARMENEKRNPKRQSE